jgi:hypothetical protein
MPQPGYVYIVHGVGTRYVKIGQTNDVAQRLARIGHGVPFPVQLLYAEMVYDKSEAEARLHAQYAHRRVNGEWFELSLPELAQWPVVTQDDPEQLIAAPRRQPPATTMREKLLMRLSERSPRSARDLLRTMSHGHASDIREALADLMEDQMILHIRDGKRTLYLRRNPELTREEQIAAIVRERDADEDEEL